MAASDRESLLGKKWLCDCGREHEVPIRRALVGQGVLEKLPALMKELGLTGKGFLLADERTCAVAGESVAVLCEQAGYSLERHILEGHPHADDTSAEAVSRMVNPSCRFLITCGSGTITDLGKWAAYEKKIPLLVVATAPSMNGYASGIVALTCGGLKTTQPVKPAIAVVADIDILSHAPIELIRAGLGDVVSKAVCNADWKLSSILRGEHFCKKPFELIKDLEGLYLRDAALIGKQDPKAITSLTEALIYSGVSMVLAGSSSPASGGEHLISHFLDMRSLEEGRESDFHGAQVGVATIATARLYERLLSMKVSDLDSSSFATAWERSERALTKCASLFKKAAGSVIAEYNKKRETREKFEADLLAITGRWEEIQEAVRPFLMPAEKIETALRAAGAKSRYSELGVATKEFRETLELAMCIRNRYSALDLAFAVGILKDWAENETADY